MTIPFRRPRARVRPSPIFLLVLALSVLSGWVCWNATADSRNTRVAVFVFIVAAWVVSLSLHEFAHAFLAWRFGDHDIEARGYLTLNPLRYAHPVLSILLPVLFIAIGGIGLPGGAVWVHPERFRSDLQRALVAAVGPLVNAVLAVVLIMLAGRQAPSSAHFIFWLAVSGLGLLQLMAAVLNLLPIPGLDGYGAIEPSLDRNFRQFADQVKPFGMLIVFALLQVDSINRAFFQLIFWLYDLSGQPHQNGQIGQELLKFWHHPF
ncbi:MAG: site-2 protease family protein [Jatrophihabitantaceae bacterium]